MRARAVVEDDVVVLLVERLERVLQIDPTDKTVIEALKQLNQRGSGARAPRENANPTPQPSPGIDLGQPGSELPPPR